MVEGISMHLVRNVFVPFWMRQNYPDQSIGDHKDIRDWHNARPQWEKDQIRVFIQQHVEALLPDNVVAQVQNLRYPPNMAMRGGMNAGPIAGPFAGLGGHTAGMSGGGSAVSNAMGGGVNAPMTSTPAVKTRSSKSSRGNTKVGGKSRVKGNIGVNLQNVLQA